MAGGIGRKTITVPVTVGAILALASVAVILLFIGSPDNRSVIAFAVATVAGAAGITSAYYVGAGIRSTARSVLLERTFRYAERWGDPSFVPARKALVATFDAHKDDTERKKLIREAITKEPQSDLERSVIAALSFLEEMALAIRVKAVDEDILRTFFDMIVETGWELLEGYIKDVARPKRGSTLYKELEALYVSWTKGGG